MTGLEPEPPPPLAAIESTVAETHPPPRAAVPWLSGRICAMPGHETISADFLGVYDDGIESLSNVSYCAQCAALHKDEFHITQTLVKGLVCSCGKGVRRGPLHEHSCPVFLRWSQRETASSDASGSDAGE